MVVYMGIVTDTGAKVALERRTKHDCIAQQGIACRPIEPGRHRRLRNFGQRGNELNKFSLCL
jgi:hypothetical protein